MNVVKVSIIVPVYNVEQYLERCLQSIKVQTLEAIEVILVDDGSTDNSGAICDRYATEDARFKVCHIENSGAGYARNTGLSMTQGEYIGFVDSDDYIKPEMFEILYNESQREDVELAMCSHIDVIQGKEHPYKLPISKPILRGEEKYDELLGKMIGGLTLGGHHEEIISGFVWRMLFKKQFIQAHHLAFLSEREVQYEDLWFVIQSLIGAKQILILQQQLYYYNHRAGSLVRSYKEHVWERQCKLYTQIEELATGKIESTLLAQRLATRKIVNLLEEIDSTIGKRPWRDRNNIIERLSNICEEEAVKSALAHLRLGEVSWMHQTKIKLIKQKKYRYLYGITYIACQMKKYKGEVE